MAASDELDGRHKDELATKDTKITVSSLLGGFFALYNHVLRVLCG